MSNADIYQSVTVRILECLDKGVVPWRKPWAVMAPRNLASGHVYRGINTILLACAGFDSPYWLTLKQANDLGGRIKRGERGTPIVFWKVVERPNAKDEDDDRFFLLKRFTVFNVAQTEGIEVPTVQARTFDPIAECGRRRLVQGPAEHPSDGDAGCPLPGARQDLIPKPETFTSPAEYYSSTLFHELVHSTGAAHRLGRKGVVDPSSFASHTYS
ncbi:MAG: ArdC-like ssDNA-binding domain-containing protein [Labilithrix sp.]